MKKKKNVQNVCCLLVVISLLAGGRYENKDFYNIYILYMYINYACFEDLTDIPFFISN